MAHPWSRGTAVYLRVGEQGTVWGQAQCSAVCRERLTRVSHFCVWWLWYHWCCAHLWAVGLVPSPGRAGCGPGADEDGAGLDGAASSPMLVVLVPVPRWCPAQTMLVLALAVQCSAPVPCWWCLSWS